MLRDGAPTPPRSGCVARRGSALPHARDDASPRGPPRRSHQAHRDAAPNELRSVCCAAMLCCAAAASRVASGTIRSQPPPSGPPGPTATAAGRLYTVLVAQRCENGRHGLSTALRWPPAGPAALADHPQRPTCNAGGPRRRGAVLYVRRRRCLPRMVEIEASVPSHHPAERFATAPRGDAHKCARRGRPLRAKWSATSTLRRGRSN